jgi:hypothetical protein
MKRIKLTSIRGIIEVSNLFDDRDHSFETRPTRGWNRAGLEKK